MLLPVVLMALLIGSFSEASRMASTSISTSFPTTPRNYSHVCDYCGCAMTSRTTNGETLEFPWMAFLIYKTNDSMDYPCAGTLITSRYVLTSAQCAEKDNLVKVRFGKTATSNYCDEVLKICSPLPLQEVEIESISIHGKYNDKTFINDIALIRLASTVNAYGIRTPVCLPFGEYSRANLDGKYALSSGWGATVKDTNNTHPLLTSQVPIKNLGYCRRVYYYNLFSKKQICAGGKGSKNARNVGSGGPLIISDASGVADVPKFFLYGIASYEDDSSGRKHPPRVYTNVAFYMQWIMENIKPY